ncbi:MAG: hypothetical protein ACLR8Y_17920 [Alistipes indistinctus]
MNVTTVGANIFAVTPMGKVLTVVLAASGMMMFPIFTVYITTKFQSTSKRRTPCTNGLDTKDRPIRMNRTKRAPHLKIGKTG